MGLLGLEVADCENHLQAGTQWRITDAEGRPVGSAGRVAQAVLESFDLDWPVAVAEIAFSALETTPDTVAYRPFARFPGVKRDLSLLVPGEVPWGAVREVVEEAAGPHLAALELFDIYRGKGVPEGFGAFGIRLKFRSEKGNLKGKTVDRAITGILEALDKRLGIKPRGQDGN